VPAARSSLPVDATEHAEPLDDGRQLKSAAILIAEMAWYSGERSTPLLQARRATEGKHCAVPDGPARLTRNCSHKHLAVSEAYQCLGQRPGERVYLVRPDEISE